MTKLPTKSSNTCAICHAPGLVFCQRCGAALCANHAPMAGSLCKTCEASYINARSKLRVWPWFFIPFLAAFSYIGSRFDELWNVGGYSSKGFTGHPFSDILIYTVIVGLILGGVGAATRVAIFKARFGR